jgi:hypothetical protein
MNFKSVFVCTTFLTFITVIKSSKAALDCTHLTLGVPTRDPVDDGDVERNTTLHLASTWSGRVSPSSQNYTSVEINWDSPTKPSSDNLCAYGVHYYPAGNDQQSKHLIVYVPRSSTTAVLSDLTTGTSYHIYIEAIFNQPVSGTPEDVELLKSWLLVVTTLGFGPANPCNCNPHGTVEGELNSCDQFTGKCKCKDEPLTNGLKCDSCPEHTYMDNTLGCTACDQCDHVGSTGSCLPAPVEGMNCECKANFTGKHCRDCKRGLYRIGETEICKPCNCSGNEKQTADNYCAANGICMACDRNTTGDHCELCLPGYNRDDVTSQCYRMYPSRH